MCAAEETVPGCPLGKFSADSQPDNKNYNYDYVILYYEIWSNQLCYGYLAGGHLLVIWRARYTFNKEGHDAVANLLESGGRIGVIPLKGLGLSDEEVQLV